VSNVSGIVTNVYTKQFNIKNGPRAGQVGNKHYITLDQGGDFCVGFKQPYKVGDAVSGTSEMKFGDNNFNGGVAGPGVAPAAPLASSGSSQSYAPKQAASDRTFPVKMTSPENAIIRQNALTNARELVTRVRGDLAISSATPEERKAQLLSYVEDIILVAYKFSEFSSGQREVRVVAQRQALSPASSQMDTSDDAG
jgi:hypothetical protein